MASLHSACIHASASARILQVHCRPFDPALGGEENTGRHQLVFPRAGMFVRRLGTRELVADPSQILFFHREHAFRVAHPSGCGDDCTVFELDDALLTELLDRHGSTPDAFFAQAQLSGTPRHFLLQERIRQAAGAGLAIDEATIELFADLAQRARPRPPSARRAGTCADHRALVQRVQLALAKDLSEDRDLAQLARSVHSSPFQLTRVFRAVTGLSLHQYRIGLRLAAALARLIDGATDIGALALELGFASHSHLSASFRRSFGVTPAACRRRLDADELRELSKILKAALPRPP
jgi:AraC-like DNA-binding protein